MGHVQDLWFSPGPGGEDQPTARHGKGRRWKARYLDPDGHERSKAFTRKVDADKFLTEVEHSKLAGSYLDPDADRVTLRSRIPLWLDSLTCDPTTRHHIEGRVTRHILPKLGDKRLDVLAKSPSIVQAWVAALPVGASCAQQILTDLSAVLDQAVADSLIAANPCKNAIVRAPRAVKRKLVPWTRERVAAVRAALSGRYQAMTDACGGGPAVGRGLRLVARRGRLAQAGGPRPDSDPPAPRSAPGLRAPEGREGPVRAAPPQVPLPLAAHLERFPPRPVTLPWLRPDAKPHTEELIFTGDKGGALNRSASNEKVWGPTRRNDDEQSLRQIEAALGPAIAPPLAGIDQNLKTL